MHNISGSRSGLAQNNATKPAQVLDEMREAIHRERRVELAFENKRLYDLLRWKKAFDVLNTHLHGMIIEKVDNVWNYRVFEAAFGERRFKERNYLLPIPGSVLELNKLLTPTPGY